ncbi:MAG: hypothetical protein ACPLRH_03780, partial [Desulfotomaculales bacterium]
ADMVLTDDNYASIVAAVDAHNDCRKRKVLAKFTGNLGDFRKQRIRQGRIANHDTPPTCLIKTLIITY